MATTVPSRWEAARGTAPSTPELARDIMLRFVSLGENCEFGFAQRAHQAEPLDLFRWAGTPLPVLINLLRNRFAGLGDSEQIRVRLAADGEYMIDHLGYGFTWHAFAKETDIAPDTLKRRECIRLPRLAEILIEHLTAGEKIFVVKRDAGLRHIDATALLKEIRKYGQAPLLAVTQAKSYSQSGLVEYFGDGLLWGHIKNFADPRYVRKTTDAQVWLELCKEALAAVRDRVCRPRLQMAGAEALACEADQGRQEIGGAASERIPSTSDSAAWPQDGPSTVTIAYGTGEEDGTQSACSQERPNKLMNFVEGNTSMRLDLFRSLSALSALDPNHAISSAIPCKVCGFPSRFFDVTDFYKSADGYPFGPSGISVQWFWCDACEFLFTPFFDNWTPDELAKFVYNADYARVDPEYTNARPAKQAEILARLLDTPRGLRILDYGSGAGIMVKGLRERGYEAHGYDPFSSPQRPEGRFDLITCFEVIEHSPDPMALLRDIRSLLKDDGGVILGETLQPANIDEIRCNWWYCAPRNGHCSTFSQLTLALAAERLGWAFHPGGGRHAFTPRNGGQVTELLERITGPRLTAVMLGAPANTPSPGWHGIEQPHTAPFRWTASSSVLWNIPFSGMGMLDVQIPVRMSLLPDFLKDCRILIDGRETETVVRKTGLSARVSGTATVGGTLSVELRTPAPRRPRELRGVADDRPLGLAVPVLAPVNNLL